MIQSAGGGLVAVGVNALLDNHGMIQLNRISSDGVYTDISSPGEASADTPDAAGLQARYSRSLASPQLPGES